MVPLVVALTVGGQPVAAANPDGATPEVIARLVGDVARADEQLAALQAEVHS
ncbi:hypothetical protein [Mycobacterium adipatum]|uniref:hypothetical protein n=1 Tax=Mycobacterium adipatum TaxID=1682113 RepID=UPI001E494146|nr:hypothetical protein [Mycobacterium adipatum]